MYFGVARSVAKALFAGFLFVLYIFSILLLNLPGWHLQVIDLDLIIVDLHTHSTYSHDGLVALEENFSKHAWQEFDLFVFTEHNLYDTAKIYNLCHTHPDWPFMAVGQEIKTTEGECLLTFTPRAISSNPHSKDAIEHT